MRKRIMFGTLVFALLTSFTGTAQDTLVVHPSFNIGINVPTGEELSTVHSLGAYFNVNIPLPIGKHFYLGPSLTVNHHLKYINEAAKNQFTNIGLALDFEYLYKPKNHDLAYFIGIRGGAEIVSDHISPRKDYHGDILNTVNGSGISVGPKVGLIHKHFVLQAMFTLRNFKVEFDPSIDHEFEIHNELYEVLIIKDHYHMNFSSITLSIGYRL